MRLLDAAANFPAVLVRLVALDEMASFWRVYRGATSPQGYVILSQWPRDVRHRASESEITCKLGYRCDV